MKFFQTARKFVRNSYITNSFTNTTNRKIIYLKPRCILSKNVLTIDQMKNQKHTEINDNEEIFENFPLLETEQFDRVEDARSILFKNSNDKIVTELNACVSVEEVLNLVKKYETIFEDKHITQTILVLRNLQIMFYHYNNLSPASSNQFIENLYKNQDFEFLLKLIKEKVNSFRPEYLSYVLLYMNKLGIPVTDALTQQISLKLRDHLLKEFALDICARFLSVIFTENSVRPYYICLDIIPTVYSSLGKCDSVKDLDSLTICLIKLHNIVTKNILEQFKEKVSTFLGNKKITAADYPTLLRIIKFLNYPKWRNQNISLISDCILLFKNEINSLTVNELLILYEVFFKNQEPGEILNILQRCSSKYLQQLEERESSEIDIKLRLFSSLIYFSSPTHRMQFRKDMIKFTKKCNTYSQLVLLRKIYSYVKISDSMLCSNYWKQSLNILSENKSANNIVKLCQNYMNFNTDIDNYRDHNFENKVLALIEENLKAETVMFPATMSGYLCFTMAYGKNKDLQKFLLNKFEENLSQFKARDCLNISRSLFLLADMGTSCFSREQVKTVKRLLNDCSENVHKIDSNNFLQNSILLKASILRNDFDNLTCDTLLMTFKEMEYMSSKIIENLCFIFLLTNSLIPEVINKCTEYLTKQQDKVLGFNAEKILFLCYYLAYYPINGDKFFEVVTNIIIRDQERLSGLAFLQSALSLCYFNKLPTSFIKHIFNTEFLDKLDVELANCYSKDKYPQRVRNSLMQLNRSVCLEYPQFNIPWFHKKYIEEVQKKFTKGTTDKENYFLQRVKEYLVQTLGKPQFILENVSTPYGYHVDFVINLNNKEEAVSPNSSDVNRRVAMLLLGQHAYTRFYTHLTGKYQLKRRHLEIFGYDVAIININDWTNLLYGEERLEYLRKLIWPRDFKRSVNFCKTHS